MSDRGVLIILSGPSGSGKDTVLNKLVDGRDDVRVSVSMTTRAKRDGEIDGKHYYFVNREYFESRGMSLSARTPEEQVQAGLRILHDPALRDAMLQNQHKGIHPDAADRIYDAVKAAVERRNA